ncbi:MAG: NAD-dependent deacylase [Bacteroidales bacterium]|nr:NAD-dependent deacylase [Bacteroidales bacterium]
MKHMVVLTGAGMSAESGIKTFREMGGLWEEYDVTEVASPEAWEKNPGQVLRFYNERRKQLLQASPNEGHKGLVDLEKYFEVDIITQNVDDLHERAGSSKVLHLHGELRKARSTANPTLIYDIVGDELKLGDLCEEGSQLRPHVVWFGEPVPAMETAVEIIQSAEVFVIIGTSLNVYPAAGLIWYAPPTAPVYLIDPGEVSVTGKRSVTILKEKASEGVRKLKSLLLKPEKETE